MTDRNQRIVDLVLAPGSSVTPSRINPGYVVVVDGRTGLDACERTADAAFDALFEEADGGEPPDAFTSRERPVSERTCQREGCGHPRIDHDSGPCHAYRTGDDWDEATRFCDCEAFVAAPSPLLVDPRRTEIEEAVIAYGVACVNDERIVAGSLETRAAARARVMSLVDGLVEDARRLREERDGADWLLWQAVVWGKGLPDHDCGYRMGEGTSCQFHDRYAGWYAGVFGGRAARSPVAPEGTDD